MDDIGLLVILMCVPAGIIGGVLGCIAEGWD